MPEYPERPVFVVDWDGTCVEETWPGCGDWLPGAVNALRFLSAHGKTVIYSLRCHLYEQDDVTARADCDVQAEVERIEGMLREKGLDQITVYPPNRGKPPGEFYIDDRAIRFEGDWIDVLRKVGEIRGTSTRSARNQDDQGCLV